MGFAVCSLQFIGCASVPYVPQTLPTGMPGIYHRVERGQTLWRISKIYNVDVDELAQINHIPDTTAVEIGQLIFVPNRQRPKAIEYSSDDFIWPLRGKVIATFGQTYNNMLNKGLNIQPYANLDIVAARSGRVIFYSDNFGSFGKTLIIDHGDGFSTVYARNEEVFIRIGDSVQKGNVISRAGQAGRDKSRYLHFEIRKGSIPQNPYYFLP